MDMYYVGVDAGSTTLKSVVLDSLGEIVGTFYERARPGRGKPVDCTGNCGRCGRCSLGLLRNAISGFLERLKIAFDDVACTAVTGSQIVEDTIKTLPYDFFVSEVTAHVEGATRFHPGCKAILDVGGQDSKVMVYNDRMGLWVSKMSGICAAGTGAFLDNVASKLDIPVDDLAANADLDSELEFSSICAVLAATSINKFKNRFPLPQLVGGACRAQARTILSGVGELLFGYKGDILFQGGVAANAAVAHFLRKITGNNIVIPKYHKVMGALGAALLAKKFHDLKGRLDIKRPTFGTTKLLSMGMRAHSTRRQFLGKSAKPLVWRNLFFPTEILNALDVRMLTLETYAALFARNRQKIKACFDSASCKGFNAETCSFLRTLEGMELPTPSFGVSTSQPCQQGERVFQDLVRTYGVSDRFFSLQTPVKSDGNAVEHMAAELERGVGMMERALGRKMDMSRLQEACELSNQAREWSVKCNHLRFTSPPLLRGSQAAYHAVMFSQSWGLQELVDIQRQFHEDLLARKEEVERDLSIDDTHRILWMHLPPFYDNDLMDYIELRCNMPIVFEEVNFVGWAPLDVKDPYRSLARKLLTVGYLDPEHRVQTIKGYVDMAKFDGCILYNHMFGRCSMADSSFLKHLREELAQVGVPVLALDGDCMDPTTDPCSTYTKISAFSEALNVKKYGNVFGAPAAQGSAKAPLGACAIPQRPAGALCSSCGAALSGVEE